MDTSISFFFFRRVRYSAKTERKGFHIWFVIRCPGWDIKQVIEALRSQHPDRAEDFFILTCDRMRRYQGEWHMERKPLVPDCFFIKANDTESLLRELPKASEITCMNQEEETFLESFCGNEHHSAFSKGRIQNGRTEVLSGPLHGREHLIRKIDRHKRLAKLWIPGMEHVGELCVGLEIVEKNSGR